MKTKYLICFISLFLLFSCDDADDGWVCILPPVTTFVQVFAIDYETNEFIGGYHVPLNQYIDTLELACKYHSPGDFGDISWYDKKTEKELFSGTIIWMGKGERTYPEKIDPPSSFEKLNVAAEMPTFYPLCHDEYDSWDENIDYEPIWQSIEKLQFTSWVASSMPAYIYLYRPSVGVGDPADWYWLIFLKYSY